MDKGLFGRKDRLVQEKRHDAYQERWKCQGPAVCRTCGASFVEGRWSWQEAPAEACAMVCPACARIADNYPAGEITISGPFFSQHRQEIMNLIHNAEAQEKGEHPLERLMAVVDGEGQTMVTTTGIHLARRIGEALSHAYQGQLNFAYGEAEKSIRVSWRR